MTKRPVRDPFDDNGLLDKFFRNITRIWVGVVVANLIFWGLVIWGLVELILYLRRN